MEVNVRVTIDLGAQTMALFGGMLAANRAVTEAAGTVNRVLEKYADDPTPGQSAAEPEKAAPASRRRTTDAPARTRRAKAESAPEPEQVSEPEPAPESDPAPASASASVTLDDVRDRMQEVVSNNPDARMKVLDKLRELGARSVSSIREEDLDDFYEYLRSLENE